MTVNGRLVPLFLPLCVGFCDSGFWVLLITAHTDVFQLIDLDLSSLPLACMYTGRPSALPSQTCPMWDVVE
jgi:hypothetical protein